MTHPLDGFFVAIKQAAGAEGYALVFQRLSYVVQMKEARLKPKEESTA